MFSERIKGLRIQNQMPQRQAADLNIDTAAYRKMEKGERKTKRKQVEIIARILNTDKNGLVTLWLADKVHDVADDEINAQDIPHVVNENIVRYGQDI
ncbi:MAG: helix-turn-helix transcriptional regulator [Prevotellaceae bacterium]|nr:helix-turn-helix transcriptional regulator [Prevotellaceae bacterium]